MENKYLLFDRQIVFIFNVKFAKLSMVQEKQMHGSIFAAQVITRHFY